MLRRIIALLLITLPLTGCLTGKKTAMADLNNDGCDHFFDNRQACWPTGK